MRIALSILMLFAVAVAAALLAGNNQGTVTLYWPPYRLDLSLNLALLLLVAGFVVLHLALRALAALFAMPGQARRWRLQHKERAMHLALLDALSHLFAGRFIRARKSAELALVQEEALERGGDALPYAGRLRTLAHLLAAESAHSLLAKDVREGHFQQAMAQSAQRDAHETREGVQLRAANWAMDDRDAQAALRWLDELPQGVSRRTVALRLRLKAARLAGQVPVALETARLLAKHRAFSQAAGHSIVRGLTLELIDTTLDRARLLKVWAELDSQERQDADIAIRASQRLLSLGGEAALSRAWLLPLWEQMLKGPGALEESRRVKLVETLQTGFTLAEGVPDAAWLTRIESAQMRNPGDPLYLYLAGVTCMHLQLWGKAQQLLRQSLPQLRNDALEHKAWCALAQLAEQRGDAAGATEAYRNAVRGGGKK